MFQDTAAQLNLAFDSLTPDDEKGLCVLLFAALVYDADLGDLAIQDCQSRGLNEHHACEAVLQSFLFAGFPRCINGLESFRRHYGPNACQEATPRTEGALDAQALRLRGEDLFRKIYGQNTEVVLAALDNYHPELKEWILVDAYGKILSRPALPARTRELCAVVGLLVSGDTRQLSSHIRGAVHCGAKRNEIDAAVDLVQFLFPSERLALAHTLVAKITNS